MHVANGAPSLLLQRVNMNGFCTAAKVEEGLEHDEEVQEGMFRLTKIDLRLIWQEVDTEKKGVLTREDIRKVAKGLIRTQKERLRTLIHDRQDQQKELEKGFVTWLPKWKQWGLDLQVEEKASELERAKLLHDHLDENSDQVDLLMKAIDPSGKASDVYFDEYVEAYQIGRIKDEEIKQVEEAVAETVAEEEGARNA